MPHRVLTLTNGQLTHFLLTLLLTHGLTLGIQLIQVHSDNVILQSQVVELALIDTSKNEQFIFVVVSRTPPSWQH
jgi:hypothetical protein